MIVTLLQLRKPFGMSLYPRASSTLSNSLRNMLRLTFSVSLKQVLRISLRYDKIVTTYAEAPRTLLRSLRSCSMTSRCFDSCRDFEEEEDKALLGEEKERCQLIIIVRRRAKWGVPHLSTQLAEKVPFHNLLAYAAMLYSN